MVKKPKYFVIDSIIIHVVDSNDLNREDTLERLPTVKNSEYRLERRKKKHRNNKLQ